MSTGDALLPEVMATPGVPAVVLPTSVEEFDGWEPDDIVTWLERIAKGFRQGRLSIGLGLWVLRDRLPETDYGEIVDHFEEVFDVHAGTLLRWRKAAQDHYELPNPTQAQKRIEGQQDRQSPSHTANSDPGSRKVREVEKDDPPLDDPGSGTPSQPMAHLAAPTNVAVPIPAQGDDSVDRRAVLFSVLNDEDPSDLRWFLDMMVTKGKAHLARRFEDGRPLRVLEKFFGDAAFKAGVQAGMATAAKHNAEAAKPLSRQDVSPNFKGGKS